MSYSQYDEETFILSAVSELDQRDGVFLDIGAYDGVTFSNTKALVEKGWSGVMVEPSPWLFIALAKNYDKEIKVQLVQSLVGKEQGLQFFWGSADAVSTTEFSIYSKWKYLVEYKRPCWVPQVTIRQLIGAFSMLKDAAVVNIDTEGTSADLFVNYPFDLNKPKVFCVEYDDKLADVLHFAEGKGYRVLHMNGTNVVLGR